MAQGEHLRFGPGRDITQFRRARKIPLHIIAAGAGTGLPDLINQYVATVAMFDDGATGTAIAGNHKIDRLGVSIRQPRARSQYPWALRMPSPHYSAPTEKDQSRTQKSVYSCSYSRICCMAIHPRQLDNIHQMPTGHEWIALHSTC